LRLPDSLLFFSFSSAHLYTLRGPVRGSHANPISFGESRFPQNYFVWQNLKIGSRPPNAPSWSHEAPPADLGPLGGPETTLAPTGWPASGGGCGAYPATVRCVPCNDGRVPYSGGRNPRTRAPRARGSAAVPAYPATAAAYPVAVAATHPRDAQSQGYAAAPVYPTPLAAYPAPVAAYPATQHHLLNLKATRKATLQRMPSLQLPLYT
jgi:hypothetical protein